MNSELNCCKLPLNNGVTERVKFMNDAAHYLDEQKKSTLKKLKEKKENPRVYEIEKNDLLIISRCPVCLSKDLRLLTEVYINGQLNFFSTVTCVSCLFTFRSVSPGLKWFKKCWQIIETAVPEVFNPEVELDRIARYEKYYEAISRYRKTGHLLDVGAAFGTGTNLFREKGFRVEAVEPEINKTNYLRKKWGIKVVADSIETFVRQKRRYDVIIFSACLEHIDNPVTVIKRIKNLLNPNSGLLYLEVPTIWNYVSWSDALYLTHKSNFSKEHLTYLAELGGLEIVEDFFYKPCHVGLLLKPRQNNQNKPKLIRPPKNITDIARLYRKDLPLKKHLPPLNAVIKYSVSHIEQFFQTLNLSDKKMIAPNHWSGFITFSV
ncbi:MAG: class I SAM-dependent methyltransferase [bacterium]|nr:class I SAM-dependent methyltransferase [bacterium]